MGKLLNSFIYSVKFDQLNNIKKQQHMLSILTPTLVKKWNIS